VAARPTHADVALGASRPDAAARAGADRLRIMAVAGGIGWSFVFLIVGLFYELQLYGDGAMFSYSVAAQDAWAFHWHNIAERLTVFLLTLLPAETFVGLTGDPRGGIAVYGLLFFAGPLLSLVATLAADRSQGRIIFGYACFSTACLCPLVFGFPTEMWLAHAFFWPALAVAHDPRPTPGRILLLFALLLMLILTHEGAIVLAGVIVATLLPRGARSREFLGAAGAFMAALLFWLAVKLLLPPDAYFADVLVRAALDFFDPGIFTSRMVVLLLAGIAGYVVILLALARVSPGRAPVYAVLIVALALAAYWIALDHGLHAADRYYLRTILVIVTPVFGIVAALHVLHAGGRPMPPLPGLARFAALLSSQAVARAIGGAFVLVMLMHAVETAKFVAAWTQYKAAVTDLATGTLSDPALGDPQFVSSGRIGADLNRLSWYSTTPYLSVILAKLAPTRLVVDPRVYNYFWLSCATATANLDAARAVPVATRKLVQAFACLHR
jgi:hypothetical protein